PGGLEDLRRGGLHHRGDRDGRGLDGRPRRQDQPGQRAVAPVQQPGRQDPDDLAARHVLLEEVGRGRGPPPSSLLAYIGRRALLAIFTVWAISVLSFVIIQLPPGDYVTAYIAQMASMRSVVSDEEAQNLRIQYGLGQPVYVQYYKWIKQIVQGNFGMSMEWRRPVTEVIGERLWLTVAVSVSALLLTWALALPIGIYSATRQYSAGDYLATFVGFIGLAVPNFLLALVLLYLGFTLFNANIGGLFSPELQDAPWSWTRVWDLLKHLPMPALILGLAGTAQQIRIMRANLLDELRKPYVVTARAKGLSWFRVVMKYPVR